MNSKQKSVGKCDVFKNKCSCNRPSFPDKRQSWHCGAKTPQMITMWHHLQTQLCHRSTAPQRLAPLKPMPFIQLKHRSGTSSVLPHLQVWVSQVWKRKSKHRKWLSCDIIFIPTTSSVLLHTGSDWAGTSSACPQRKWLSHSCGPGSNMYICFCSC